MRVRGLKLEHDSDNLSFPLSHPVRVRGLKPFENSLLRPGSLSHPVRVRGLKLIDPEDMQEEDKVAPRSGAWV